MSNGNKSAFALEWSTFEWGGGFKQRIYHRQHGLTKRELFAAMAMQGLCANTNIVSRGDVYDMSAVAEAAATLADALLAALTERSNEA